jgi:hypothetical protein
MGKTLFALFHTKIVRNLKDEQSIRNLGEKRDFSIPGALVIFSRSRFRASAVIEWAIRDLLGACFSLQGQDAFRHFCRTTGKSPDCLSF